MRSTIERRSIQAPGMTRHDPFPGIRPARHHLIEALPPSGDLENKLVVQGAEMEKLARDNQRLATTNLSLRRELTATQLEMQRIHAHVGSIHAERNIELRGLLEKIAKLEPGIHAGETLKKELHQAHLEAQNLVKVRQELAAEIQRMTVELQKVNADCKQLPDLHSELEDLRQEHQKLCGAFEYEKGLNVKQMDQIQNMEKNLKSIAQEVETLRAEVLNAEKRLNSSSAHGYSHTAVYTNPNYAYDHGSCYSSASFIQGHQANYTDGYARPSVLMPMAPVVDGYGRPLLQMAQGMNSHKHITGAAYTDVYINPPAGDQEME